MTTATLTADTQIADSNNVVLNDKAIAAADAKAIIYNAIVELEQQRIEWEEGVYRTSNQALYAILSQCLQYGADLPTTEGNKDRREALDAFYQHRGYRIKKETPLMTRIVRAVFGDIDRRRISTYSLVLRQAKKEAVSPDAFANWVEERGGVQEVRLARSSTFVSPKAKAATAQSSFKQMNKLAVVKTEELSQLANPDFIGEDCLLVATQEADGSFTVRALVTANSAVNAAFTAIYQAEKTEAERREKEHKAAIEAAVKAELEASKEKLAA
jgi:hypothetical protein